MKNKRDKRVVEAKIEFGAAVLRPTCAIHLTNGDRKLTFIEKCKISAAIGIMLGMFVVLCVVCPMLAAIVAGLFLAQLVWFLLMM